MSDELVCFRRAAELGCSDFYTYGTMNPNGAGFRVFSAERDIDVLVNLPYSHAPINRYAAAVCAEWWADRARNAGMDNTKRYDSEMFQLLARAFGKKYGGE